MSLRHVHFHASRIGFNDQDIRNWNKNIYLLTNHQTVTNKQKFNIQMIIRKNPNFTKYDFIEIKSIFCKFERIIYSNWIFFSFQLLIVCSKAYAQSAENFKIESCKIQIMNSASELVKLEHKPIHDQLLIQQHSSLTEIQRRPTTER